MSNDVEIGFQGTGLVGLVDGSHLGYTRTRRFGERIRHWRISLPRTQTLTFGWDERVAYGCIMHYLLFALLLLKCALFAECTGICRPFHDTGIWCSQVGQGQWCLCRSCTGRCTPFLPNCFVCRTFSCSYHSDKGCNHLCHRCLAHLALGSRARQRWGAESAQSPWVWSCSLLI